MSRSSRPDSSPEALRRSLHPEEYPCYDLEGVYKYTPGCRGRCCFTAGTPEGEDSPKWKETLAVRQEDAPPMAQQEGGSPLAQPNFDSPKKTFTHDKSSGITPPDVRGEERDRVQAILRASKGWETAHPGAPGNKRKADAIDVDEYALCVKAAEERRAAVVCATRTHVSCGLRRAKTGWLKVRVRNRI